MFSFVGAQEFEAALSLTVFQAMILTMARHIVVAEMRVRRGGYLRQWVYDCLAASTLLIGAWLLQKSEVSATLGILILNTFTFAHGLMSLLMLRRAIKDLRAATSEDKNG